MAPRRNLLINRNYARLWTGQAVSTVGDFAFDTTLVLWIGTILAREPDGHFANWAPAAVSGLMICIFGAVMVIGPIAGVFVDRWSRRRTMLGSELIRAAAVAVLTALSLLPRDALPIWAWLTILYLVVFVINAVAQFFSPARFAVLGDIVDGDADRARAAGIGQATSATAAIIGPPLAAPLLVTSGLQWALLLNAASYIVSFFAIRSIAMPAADVQKHPEADSGKPRLRDEFVAGLKMFAGNRFLVTLLTIAVLCQLGTGAINALDVFFITGNLHADSHLFGLASMAFGIGSIVGALSAGFFVRRFSARVTTWVTTILGGALFVGYSRQTEFVWGLVLVVAFSIPITMLNTAITPLLLQSTPKEFLGRMMAVFNPVNMGASMLSVITAGWLASTVLADFHGSVAGVHVGRIDIIFSVAGLLIVAGGVYGAIALPRDKDSSEQVPAQRLPSEPDLEPA
jgi:MFS family permease